MTDPQVAQKNEEKSAAAKNLAPTVGNNRIPGQPDPVASMATLEKDEPQVVAKLRELVQMVAKQTTVARRLQIQRTGKAEMYWQGRQHIWWNEADGKFYDSSQTGVVLPGLDNQTPRFSFTKNYYSPFGESFIAALTQMIPKTPFRPVDPNSEDDIVAARAATDAAELIARNNDPKKLMRRMGYHGYTGGLIATYTRFVEDGNKFGWEPQPNQTIEFGVQQPQGGGTLRCANCGTEVASSAGMTVSPSSSEGVDTLDQPPSSNQSAGQDQSATATFPTGVALSTDQSAIPTQTCPQCGQPLTQENSVAQQAKTAVTGATQQKVPKGQEVTTVHGAAEINVPIWADEQSDMSYLNWQVEVPRSLAKATFPWAAENISSTGQITADDSYARLYRTAVRENLQTVVPTDALEDLVTLNRVWLRPWLFEDIKDEAGDTQEAAKVDPAQESTKQKIKRLFPDGAYVCFAGQSYCEARNESMDDKWVVVQALEGEGQSRRACGEAFLDLQDAINTLFNLAMEYIEFGCPEIYHHPKAINADAINSHTSKPFVRYPIATELPPGTPVSNLFWTSPQIPMPPEIMKMMEMLQGPDGQFIVGIFPALFGGEAKGAGGDTASGYEMQRNQAMARLVAIYDQIKLCYQRTMTLAVREFAKRRQQDVSLGSKNPAQKPRSISPSAIRKGNYTTYAEADEAYPLLYSEKRAAIEKLMGMVKDNPALGEVLDESANQSYMKSIEGLTELVIPGEDSRDKQLREIELLLQAAPLEYNPEAGAFVSSMPPEPCDRDDYEIQECDRWVNSDAGQQARYNNVEGYQNVVAHRFMHAEAKLMKANPQMLPGTMKVPTPPISAPTLGAGKQPPPIKPNGNATPMMT